ncbi:MAG TPA: hypothetical protein VK689_22215, partial [Armatimonadota bacterium]|nr:hypothetical protein [Armatimonadota bacterium]
MLPFPQVQLREFHLYLAQPRLDPPAQEAAALREAGTQHDHSPKCGPIALRSSRRADYLDMPSGVRKPAIGVSLCITAEAPRKPSLPAADVAAGYRSIKL